MSGEIATLTAKGQVTIPKPVRESLGIEEKDRLLFVVEAGRAILIPIKKRPISELYGALPATRHYQDTQAVREAIQKELGERMARGDE